LNMMNSENMPHILSELLPGKIMQLNGMLEDQRLQTNLFR